MTRSLSIGYSLTALLLSMVVLPAYAQSFRVQCPTSTITHPNAAKNNSEPAYTGATYPSNTSVFSSGNTGPVNGAIKCQQISGGDGYATMGDGTQTYMFSFGPLSGLADMANGKPGTQFPIVFNQVYDPTVSPPLQPGDPATTGLGSFTYNGAVGLANNIKYVESVYDASEGCDPAILTGCTSVTTPAHTVTIILNTPSPFAFGDQVIISGLGAGYDSPIVAGKPVPWTITKVGVPNAYFNNTQAGGMIANGASYAFQFTSSATGLAEVNEPATASAASAPGLDGHVDPRLIMDVGV